jgi:hypothetical protein
MTSTSEAFLRHDPELKLVSRRDAVIQPIKAILNGASVEDETIPKRRVGSRELGRQKLLPKIAANTRVNNKASTSPATTPEEVSSPITEKPVEKPAKAESESTPSFRLLFQDLESPTETQKEIVRHVDAILLKMSKFAQTRELSFEEAKVWISEQTKQLPDIDDNVRIIVEKNLYSASACLYVLFSPFFRYESFTKLAWNLFGRFQYIYIGETKVPTDDLQDWAGLIMENKDDHDALISILSNQHKEVKESIKIATANQLDMRVTIFLACATTWNDFKRFTANMYLLINTTHKSNKQKVELVAALRKKLELEEG